MSNFPSFLPTVRTTNPIVNSGGEFSAAEISALRTQMHSLHFHPIVVVCPKDFHVKYGEAMVAEIAKQWQLGPHGMLIVYAPANKDIWATCGKFNSSAGVDVGFFKRDFEQRMSNDGRAGDLSSALTSSLQDVDRVIVNSQAYATRAVNNQTSVRTPTSHSNHQPSYPGGQMLLAIVLALVILRLFAQVTGKGQTRRMRLQDDRHSADPPITGLASDVDRILRVTGAGNGESVRLRNTHTQVPMAEFKKRASVPMGRTTASSSAVHEELPADYSASRRYNSANSGYEQDQAADFQTAMESSAARQVASERAAEQAAAQAPQEVAATEANDAGGAVDASGLYAPPTSALVYASTFESQPATSSGSSSSVVVNAESNRAELTPSPQVVSTIPAAALASGSLSASDSFNNSFGAQPFADMMTRLGDPVAATALPTTQAEIACPKCAEPKAKDFSFCLKCGHNF